MNNEQLNSLIRSLVQMACAGYVAKGIITEANVTTLAGAAQLLIPALIALATTWYGSITNRSNRNLVAAARKVQEKQDVTIRTVR